MSDSKRRAPWDGGFIHTAENGRRTYVIRKRIGGRLFEVSTRCSSSEAANEQWKRFQADPINYRPSGTEARDPLLLDLGMSAAFLTWSRDQKKNTPKWVSEQRRELSWWLDRLKGKDLRGLSLDADILIPLEGAPGRAQKINVIKTLFSWLIEARRAMKPAEDPTFRTLKVPQARPEQWSRTKAFGRVDYEKVRKQLRGEAAARVTGPTCSFKACKGARYAKALCSAHYRQDRRGQKLTSLRVAGAGWLDLIDILAATGWHVAELERFARSGQVLQIVGRGPVLESPYAKAGNPLRTEVSAAVGKIAERVLERGPFSVAHFNAAIREAARSAKVKVTPGAFRHAIATWAINAGTAPKDVSAFLNHKSERTTRRFYATFAVAAKVPTLR